MRLVKDNIVGILMCFSKASFILIMPTIFFVNFEAIADPITPFGINGNGSATYWATSAAPAGELIASMQAKWKVPRAPKANDGQSVNYWIGLEPLDHSAVLQPVLQWLPQRDSQGQWVVFCMAVAADGSVKTSSQISVHEGEELVGHIQYLKSSTGGFEYTCEFLGIKSSRIQFLSPAKLNRAVIALETYGMQKCANYPDPSDFNEIQIAPIGIKSEDWSKNRNTNEDLCGESVNINDASWNQGNILLIPNRN